MRHIAVFVVAAMFAGASSPASALDLCRTSVLRDVHALEDRASVMRKGDQAEAVTQYVKDRRGNTSFCSHGGYCYPAELTIGGKKVPAQKLVNCTVDWSSGDKQSDGETIYYLKVDRTRNSAHDLRLYDVAERLLQLGASEAGSSNLAVSYVEHPQSRCGRFARLVLSGDRRALSRMENGDEC